MISFNKEQIIIVTGASSGIGRATALLLNELGATVVAIGRNLDRLNETKASAKFPEHLFMEQKDLIENMEELPSYITSLKNKYGKFYGLVCCAGVTQIIPIKSLTLDDAMSMLNINYLSPLFMLKGFCDKRNNVGLGSSVVLISSDAAFKFLKGSSVYSSAKSALNALGACAPKEYKNIRINTIMPGYTETNMTKNIVDSGVFDVSKEDVCQPIEIANLSAFLLSSKSRFINGALYSGFN